MSEYLLTIEDDDAWTLTISDRGVSTPAAHAGNHGSAGSDPITIANTQVTGLGTMSTQAASAVAITGGSITGITDITVADGGTGASNATDARSNLGLGNISVQAKSAVDITGGTIVGITDLAVADGGTGASSASAARTNLGLGTIATQAASAVAITGGTIAGTTISTSTLTSPTINTPTISGGSVTGITDLAVADGGTGASTASAARTNLDVPATNSTIRWRSDITAYTGGTSNALDSIDISNTTTYPTGAGIAFSVSGDLVVYHLTTTGAAQSSPNIIRPVSYGGREWTLISSLGTEFQPLDDNLTALAGLTGTADDIPYFTGAGAMALLTLESFSKSAIQAADPGTFLGHLGIVFGSSTLVDGIVTESIAGVTAASTAFATHAGTVVGGAGVLSVTCGSGSITVESFTAVPARETNDDNDIYYLVIK